VRDGRHALAARREEHQPRAVVARVRAALDVARALELVGGLGHRLAGYVLYTGQQTLPFGNRLRALPIDALWNTAP
jgi:hypothetical protein